MAKIGYARVSTRGQNDDSQVDDLTAYGCEKIFTDTASGKNAARPELDKALAYLRAGDPTVLPSGGGQGDRQVGGYSILQGESLDEISKLLDGHPHFHSPDASIEGT